MDNDQHHCLSCQSLEKIYQEGKIKVNALHEVNLKVRSGEKIAIWGKSGSGKTTLLNLLAGLDVPSKGTIYWSNKKINGISPNKLSLLRNYHLGFIYQFHHLLSEFSVLENVMLPLMVRKDVSKEKIYKDALQILQHVELSHKIHNKPNMLSGGERQRVAVARALVTHPRCILADEPTGNLDAKNAENVFSIIYELSNKLKISLILVTHEKKFIQTMDKVYQIFDGKFQALRQIS